MDPTSAPGALARLRACLVARLQALRAFRLRFHAHWRELLRHAWSIRFLALALLCDAVAMFCGFFTDAPGDVRPWFAGIGSAATVLAGIARLMPQQNVTNGGAS